MKKKLQSLSSSVPFSLRVKKVYHTPKQRAELQRLQETKLPCITKQFCNKVCYKLADWSSICLTL